MLGVDLVERAHHRRPVAGIVDGRAGELPGAGPRFLAQGEHVHVVPARQALDEREERRDDPRLAGTIDAARHHHREFHADPDSRLRSASAASSGCLPRSSR